MSRKSDIEAQTDIQEETFQEEKDTDPALSEDEKTDSAEESSEDTDAVSSSEEPEKAEDTEAEDASVESTSDETEDASAESVSDETEDTAGDDASDRQKDTDAEDGSDEPDDADETEDADMSDEKSDKKRIRRRQRRNKKKKEKKPMGKKPWIIAGSILGGLVVIYLGISAYFIGHFFINTTINGKDFSGKSAADVEAYMKEQVSDYELTLVEMNNETDVIKGSEISLVYREDSAVEDALEEQNPLLWVKAFFSRSARDVKIQVDYDEEALTEKIQSIKAVTQEQTEPESAYPKFDGESFVVEPEVYGTAVNADVLNEKIKEYITEFEPKLVLLDEGCYKLPKYTADSPEVQAACDAMNEYCKASITYKMTEDEVVDKAVISEWLSYDDEMNVSLDEKAVREWMREFGKKYDTVGKKRTITTPTGKSAEVSGGTYGWSVDEDSETKTLIESIKKGEVAEKEPAYVQKAASRGAQDWGNTYLEVDLSAQHMWYIVDGNIALETDVVTGIPQPDRITPTGVYSILEMKRDKTLVGTTDPSTGKPIYETPVRYWMRVTWTGIGFHDADWQSSFGGTRYQTSAGSHGCINMPVSKAGDLYGMLSVGTPVIIHN